jgi:threonine aldolase
LGAPVGSVLVGPKPLMDEARRWRKMVGGGMRQAGILASAALYALEHNVERLAEDHSNAQALAKRLQGIDTLEIVGGGAHTNMVYLRCTDGKGQALLDWCTQRGVLFTGTGPARLVVHKDISAQMIDQAADVILQYYGAA